MFRSDRDLCDYIDQRAKKIVEEYFARTMETDVRRCAIRVVKAATDCGSRVPVVTYANSNNVDRAIKELSDSLK